MRNKEKVGIIKAIQYALTLKNEKELHPAVITACKTQDELDIYLACLESNLLDLFDSFEVKLENVSTKRQINYEEGSA